MNDPITAFGHLVLRLLRRPKASAVPPPAAETDRQMEALRRELERLLDADEARHG